MLRMNARALIHMSDVMPLNKFLKVKVNGIICDIKVANEIARGVAIKEGEQLSMEENT